MARLYMLIVLACLCNLAFAQDECYEVSSESVGDAHLLAVDVCEINDALKELDYDTARLIYENGSNSDTINLRQVATAQYPTPMYQKYTVFFGDQVWMHTYIDQALAGEGDFDSDVKRVQVIKKVLQASVLVQQVFFYMDSAVAKIEQNNPQGALASVDKAMAAYYGGNIDCSPFGNGQGRGIEFDTIADGVSTTNSKIHAAFKSAGEALSADDTTDAFDIVQAARTEIVKQVTIIYIQAAFKYSTLVDDGLDAEEDVEKSQAEGYGYYLAIQPLIADVDPEGAAAIADAFDISKVPDNEDVEQVIVILSDNFGKLSIADDEVKDFDKDAVDNYEQPDVTSCVLENPFSTDDSSKPGNVDG